MMQVWKYPFSIQYKFGVEMPVGAIILDVQVQNRVPCIWAIGNPEAEKELRPFTIIGTGQDVELEELWLLEYIGTIQLDSFVWHIFQG